MRRVDCKEAIVKRRRPRAGTLLFAASSHHANIMTPRRHYITHAAYVHTQRARARSSSRRAHMPTCSCAPVSRTLAGVHPPTGTPATCAPAAHLAALLPAAVHEERARTACITVAIHLSKRLVILLLRCCLLSRSHFKCVLYQVPSKWKRLTVQFFKLDICYLSVLIDSRLQYIHHTAKVLHFCTSVA